MESIGKRKYKVICIIAMVSMILFFGMEISPARIYSSSIFTVPGNTEIEIMVLMNTLFPVDVEKLAKEMIYEEQKINGMRENPVYKVNLYRSLIHYRNAWKYDSLVCDENGVIICDEMKSVL